MSILQILILSGGIVYKPLSCSAQKRIDKAVKQIFEKVRILLKMNHDQSCTFTLLPQELKDFIFKITFYVTSPNLVSFIFERSKWENSLWSFHTSNISR